MDQSQTFEKQPTIHTAVKSDKSANLERTTVLRLFRALKLLLKSNTFIRVMHAIVSKSIAFANFSAVGVVWGSLQPCFDFKKYFNVVI